MSTEQLSATARRAARSSQWNVVEQCAARILKQDKRSAEGHFLSGLAAKASGRLLPAEKSFKRTLMLNVSRYDAAIELAELFVQVQRIAEAIELLSRYTPQLTNSPVYLGMAARCYTRLYLYESAWPLYKKACELQPGVDQFQWGLASCCVFLGKTGEAIAIYKSLLQRQPNHQRFHYELAQLTTAKSFEHVEQMKKVLELTAGQHARNIFIYYALGKELEDLGSWDEAFGFYELGGDAAKDSSGYDVQADLDLIETIMTVCNEAWLRDNATDSQQPFDRKAIFVVGLPRSGTTLTERIIGSHSQVRSIGETFFLQQALRDESQVQTADGMNAAIARAASARSAGTILARYMSAVGYKLGEEPVFVEKLPENYLYLGFIAKGMPDARIVHVRRHPLDSCFAMFKQSYFRYAYTLEDVGRYYVAYNRLMDHWRSLLGDRLIEVTYETLVSNQEQETRKLLARLGLEFESACLEFEKNTAASNTASAVQVREKMHSRSVNRWRHFERQLQPLKSYLEAQGIAV